MSTAQRSVDAMVADPDLVLRLHPALRVLYLDEGRVQIRGVNDNVTIDDPEGLIRTLLAGCDGRTHVGQILMSLFDDGERQTFARLVEMFLGRAFLVRSSDTFPSELLLNQLDHIARKANKGGRQTSPRAERTVAVFGRGVLAESVSELLRSLNIAALVPEVVPEVDAPDDVPPSTLGIVCADGDDVGHALAWNRKLVAAGRPALHACTSEFTVRVGPYVLPGEGACYACYDRRRRSLARFPRELDAYLDGAHGAGDHLSRPILAGGFAAHLVAIEVAKILRGLHDLVRPASISELNVITGAMERSTVLKLPRCEVCGPSQAMPAAAIRTRQNGNGHA